MPRSPGLPKTGGRKVGTPNRKSELLQDALRSAGFAPVERLIALLPELEKEKQADILLELLSYLYPKRKAIEHSGPAGTPIPVDESRRILHSLLRTPENLDAIQRIAEQVTADGPAK